MCNSKVDASSFFDAGNPTSCFSAKASIDEQRHHTEPTYSFALQLINNELEKFLEAEAKEIDDDSSARSSYASIITISNKQFDGADTEGWRYSVTCPLQKYLFGSSIEVPETAVVEKKEKASLEELFKRNDNVHKDTKEKYDSIQKQECINGISASCMQVLRVFHRKVYPEALLAEKQFSVAEKDNEKSISGETRAGNEAIRGKKRSPEMADLNKEMTPSELFPRRVKSDATEANREHWIKTDAEYLVLEL